MKAKSTSQLLTKLRSLMNTTSCAEHMLQAVIIPSSDAHQVNATILGTFFCAAS